MGALRMAWEPMGSRKGAVLVERRLPAESSKANGFPVERSKVDIFQLLPDCVEHRLLAA
jgi:hypothetical protein